jgi:nucleotide-binding universal stress UspA family protein
MTAFKSVLAISEGGPDAATSFRLASRIARAFESSVDAVHFSWRKPGDVNIAAQALPYLEELDKGRLAQRARNSEGAYAEFISGLAGASFASDRRLELAGLVGMGRRADLIVIGRPGMDPENAEPPSAGAAIHACARPVMIAPANVKDGAFASVLVAWNGSRQAARAVDYAMPVLKRSTRVAIVVVDNQPAKVAAPLLVKYLARHGVSASLDVIHAGTLLSGRARGRALLDHAKASQADLLVMGAYGGGQLRSFLGVGGATAKVLSSCPIPLLVAH